MVAHLVSSWKCKSWSYQYHILYSLHVFVWFFVCLGFIVPLEIFPLIWTHNHYCWRAANFARLSWQLSSEGSLACHTYCDTGQPFVMVISEDPWHLHLLPSVLQWSCHYLFLRLRSVAAGIRTPNLPPNALIYKDLAVK